MRRVFAGLLIVALGVSAAAQQMPDPSQMAGQPLPAPELETGMVSVRVVRERMGNNVTNHPVTLAGQDQRLDANTDAQGRATFGDIPPGTRVVVQSIVDGETLQSQPFTVPTSGGVRIALIAGLEAAAERERRAREEAARQPARQGIVVFGGESRVIMEFQDDNLQVFYLLDIVNNARTPIDIGEPLFIVLPDGATGAGALQGSSTQAVVQGDRIRINGPFPPGLTQVQVGYRFAYQGDTAVLSQQWPAAFEQLFVAAEKVGNLQIASPQFRQQQEASAGGAPFLMATGGRINAGDSLTVTLTGLPHRSTLTRDVGVAVGVLTLIVGFWAALTGPRGRNTRTEQLARRKDELFADLVALENDHRERRIDDRRYASRRQALVAQLERVMGELDKGGGEGVAA
ncbi:MAG TPA: hypothetical protein VMO26_15870 [Vicinamibacterales bacterium]|nr:hypothetical protein [Vicinamibacterales bacterium]